MEISNSARQVLGRGSIKIRVVRNGMYQQLTFKVKKVTLGNIVYAELFIDRIVDISELLKIANSVGLPVEAQNGKAFPSGTAASDFQNL